MKFLSYVYLSVGLLYLSISWVYAEENRAKQLAWVIKSYIEERVPLTQQFPLYSEIRTKISEVIINIDNSQTETRQLLKDIAFYHNNNLQDIVKKIATREWWIERFKIWKQESIDTIKNNENTKKAQLNIPENIIYLAENDEIVIWDDIYKASYDIWWEKILYKENIWYLEVSNLTYERKIPFHEIIQEGAEKFLVYEESFFEEDEYFYTYEYDEYYNIDSTYWVYKSELSQWWFSYDEAVFLRLQDAQNNVTFSPNKVPIIPKSFFKSYWEWEQEFINASIRDLLRINKDYTQTYKDIIDTTYWVIDWLDNEEEKIDAIYHWMIEHVVYPDEYDITNQEIFSWLETFNNKSGICEWQAMLMYYMLQIAGIKEVRYVDWYVLDAPDFSDVRHAWIQVWDYFYDPSFEIWPDWKSNNVQSPYLDIVRKKNLEDFFYYKVPYDIIYTNRYNTRDMPEALFDVPRENRLREIEKRRFLLADKYSKENKYLLLEKVYFKKYYSIPAGDTINLGHILDNMEIYEYKLQNWKPIKVLDKFESSIEYYPVKKLDESIEAILYENAYDLSNFVILKVYENWVFTTYWLSDSIK